MQPPAAPTAPAAPVARAKPPAAKFTGLIFLRDVAIGLCLWLAMAAVIGEAPEVPTDSMEPTIAVGDRLWTDKLLLHFEPVRRGWSDSGWKTASTSPPGCLRSRPA